jgi:hypothetical protein
VITTTRNSLFEYDLDSGWHLLSRAVTTDNDSLAVLFPGAVSAFKWADGYVQVHELAVGGGYWVDMGTDTVATHSGQRVESVERMLPEGWSLVGALYDTLLVSDIQQSPPDCITSIFGFTWHYYAADRLLPGQGYWFDVSDDCEITLAYPYGGSGGSASASLASDDQDATGPVQLVEDNASSWRLPIAVENLGGGVGGLCTLVLGFDPDATSAIDPHLGEREVPPWPPSQVLDCRSTVDAGNGLYLDLRNPDQEQEFEIVWQPGASGYPITLRWDPKGLPEGLDLTLCDNINGSFLGPVDMTAESSITIGENQAFVTGVTITAVSGQAGVANDGIKITEFDLKRNVPNPFSPMTTIVFDVPREALVEVMIYDALGREVRVLEKGVLGAGRHMVMWDGRDQRGQDVGAGLYFCRMQAGEFTKTQKLSLVR